MSEKIRRSSLTRLIEEDRLVAESEHGVFIDVNYEQNYCMERLCPKKRSSNSLMCPQHEVLFMRLEGVPSCKHSKMNRNLVAWQLKP